MKISRVLPLLLLCTATFTVPIYAQDDEGLGVVSKNNFSRYLTVHAGAVYGSFYDEAIAPLRYEGFGPMAGFGNVRLGEFNYSELSVQGAMSTTKRKEITGNTLDPKVKTAKAMADYRLLYKMDLINNERYTFLVGGMLSGMFAHRSAPHLANSGNIYEYALSLAPAVRVSKEIDISSERKGHVSFDIAFPLVSNISRPQYLNRMSSMNPDVKPFSELFSNAKWTSFGGYMRINTRIRYEYPLTNGNILMLGYQWDYYRMKTLNAVYAAEHTASVTFMFNY